jgi:hypothetical protein
VTRSRGDAVGRATEVPLHDPVPRPTLEDVTGARWRRRALAVFLMMALFATAHPAAAVVRGGACSGPSHWRLRVVPDGDLLRVRLAVRGGRAGQRWNIFMDHNGTGFFAGHRISGENGAWACGGACRTSPAPTRSASAPTTSRPARPAAAEPPS